MHDYRYLTYIQTNKHTAIKSNNSKTNKQTIPRRTLRDEFKRAETSDTSTEALYINPDIEQHVARVSETARSSRNRLSEAGSRTRIPDSGSRTRIFDPGSRSRLHDSGSRSRLSEAGSRGRLTDRQTDKPRVVGRNRSSSERTRAKKNQGDVYELQARPITSLIQRRRATSDRNLRHKILENKDNTTDMDSNR